MDSVKDSTSFWGFEFINGYAKSKKAWKENSRVKILRVYHNQSPKFLLRLVDTDRPQTVEFPGTKYLFYLHKGDVVVMELVSVFPGTKHKDVAITEINLHGAH